MVLAYGNLILMEVHHFHLVDHVLIFENPNPTTFPILPLTNPISVPKFRFSITVDPIAKSMYVGVLNALLRFEVLENNTLD